MPASPTTSNDARTTPEQPITLECQTEALTPIGMHISIPGQPEPHNDPWSARFSSGAYGSVGDLIWCSTRRRRRRPRVGSSLDEALQVR
jgi:hypothetical protein